MRKLVYVLPALFLLGFAFAQEVAPVAPDVGAWFASTTALAGIVLGIVGNLLGYVEGSIVAAIGFGVSAGLLASGGWDAVTGALSKSRAG